MSISSQGKSHLNDSWFHSCQFSDTLLRLIMKCRTRGPDAPYPHIQYQCWSLSCHLPPSQPLQFWAKGLIRQQDHWVQCSETPKEWSQREETWPYCETGCSQPSFPHRTWHCYWEDRQMSEAGRKWGSLEGILGVTSAVLKLLGAEARNMNSFSGRNLPPVSKNLLFSR